MFILFAYPVRHEAKFCFGKWPFWHTSNCMVHRHMNKKYAYYHWLHIKSEMNKIKKNGVVSKIELQCISVWRFCLCEKETRISATDWGKIYGSKYEHYAETPRSKRPLSAFRQPNQTTNISFVDSTVSILKYCIFLNVTSAGSLLL
jgi:hypothetical protein